MEFRKYNSIENSYQEKYLELIVSQGYGEMEYIVQEKVHGANLSFITNGEDILTAKRTEILADSESFYNVKDVREKYREQILSLFRELESHGARSITIFGELFGGAYPHKEVKRNSLASTVQKGVFYTPDNDFMAFDIWLGNTGTFLDAELAESLFEKHGFLYAKTLFKGSLKECLQYPNQFITTLPAQFGLPEIEGNFCEGVVIRPVKTVYMYSGSRVLIKNKNEKFGEKTSRKVKMVVEEKISEEAALLCSEIATLVNENRLNNVISKTGEVSQKDFGKLVGLLCKDALEDFLKEHQETYEKLEKNEMKAVNKFANKEAQKLLKNYFNAY